MYEYRSSIAHQNAVLLQHQYIFVSRSISWENLMSGVVCLPQVDMAMSPEWNTVKHFVEEVQNIWPLSNTSSSNTKCCHWDFYEYHLNFDNVGRISCYTKLDINFVYSLHVWVYITGLVPLAIMYDRKTFVAACFVMIYFYENLLQICKQLHKSTSRTVLLRVSLCFKSHRLVQKSLPVVEPSLVPAVTTFANYWIYSCCLWFLLWLC